MTQSTQRAVITEAHRVSAVITSRLIRVSPHEMLKFRDWEIPAGVSSNLYCSPTFLSLTWRYRVITSQFLTATIDANKHDNAFYPPRPHALPGPLQIRSRALGKRRRAATVGEIRPSLLQGEQGLHRPAVSDRCSYALFFCSEIFLSSSQYTCLHSLCPLADHPCLPLLLDFVLTHISLRHSLAGAELYLTLAYMFRRFDFELFDTTAADVVITRDAFAGGFALESKGIRVKVVGKLK